MQEQVISPTSQPKTASPLPTPRTRPVHTLLAERHQAEAARERDEAARLIRPAGDLKFHPDTQDLKRQVSEALLTLASTRERLAQCLHGTAEPTSND